ncbi:MAG: alpha/beta hydrolase family esterase [Rubinisphaera brasiliensis]|uniref:alpha/beta hydrolase family esterase n=1 Tax=Rubinisphaera brasiliensis TaxID=119 RepID=UPI00391BBD65
MKRFPILSAVVLAVAIVALVAYWPRTTLMDSYNAQLKVGQITRDYQIVIPHALPDPAPIVFAFHGIGDSPEAMANYSRLDRLASRNGFILVYPAARKSMWATIDSTHENVDDNPDVRFFDELLHHLSDRYDIDRNRIYAVGMSNGASFAQLLASARPGDLAAVVAHSGAKPRELESADIRCPIMIVVGSEDSASSALQANAENYRSSRHVVEFISVPGLGHEWSIRHNDAIWKFLSEHSL